MELSLEVSNPLIVVFRHEISSGKVKLFFPPSRDGNVTHRRKAHDKRCREIAIWNSNSARACMQQGCIYLLRCILHMRRSNLPQAGIDRTEVLLDPLEDLEDAAALSPELLLPRNVVRHCADRTPDVCWEVVLISFKGMSRLNSSFDMTIRLLHFTRDQRRKRFGRGVNCALRAYPGQVSASTRCRRRRRGPRGKPKAPDA